MWRRAAKRSRHWLRSGRKSWAQPSGRTRQLLRPGRTFAGAMTLVSRIHQQFEVEVSLRDVFEHPTLEALAKVIAGQVKSAYEAIEPAKEQLHYPVSSAQKRMYVLSQMEDVGTSYNMPAVLQLEGGLDQERLSEAMNGLIARHESLRTSFELVEEKWCRSYTRGGLYDRPEALYGLRRSSRWRRLSVRSI